MSIVSPGHHFRRGWCCTYYMNARRLTSASSCRRRFLWRPSVCEYESNAPQLKRIPLGGTLTGCGRSPVVAVSLHSTFRAHTLMSSGHVRSHRRDHAVPFGRGRSSHQVDAAQRGRRPAGVLEPTAAADELHQRDERDQVPVAGRLARVREVEQVPIRCDERAAPVGEDAARQAALTQVDRELAQVGPVAFTLHPGAISPRRTARFDRPRHGAKRVLRLKRHHVAPGLSRQGRQIGDVGLNGRGGRRGRPVAGDGCDREAHDEEGRG